VVGLLVAEVVVTEIIMAIPPVQVDKVVVQPLLPGETPEQPVQAAVVVVIV
jgi:hypothetical protein